MKGNLKSSLWFVVCGALLLGVACEPTREELRDDLAAATCQRAEDCGKIPGSFDSYDDCIVDKRADYNDLWPESECSNGRINEDLARSCIARRENYSCNSSFLDDLAFINECNADKVCIDPID